MDHETEQPHPDDGGDDTEGQAFKWMVVNDPKSGRQLRQSWTPDEPEAGRGRTPPPKGKQGQR